MPRPDRSAERRRELLPVVAAAFAELGYRRATTAELAARCGCQETILYRLWPDKKAMFVEALDHVFGVSQETWKDLAESGADGSLAERILRHEAEHHGEQGLYRLLFAGLSETDEPEIAEAMRRVYGRFQRFVRDRVAEHREETALAPDEGLEDASLVAWALVGLGSVANIGREVGLLPDRARRRLFREVGGALLGR